MTLPKLDDNQLFGPKALNEVGDAVNFINANRGGGGSGSNYGIEPDIIDVRNLDAAGDYANWDRGDAVYIYEPMVVPTDGVDDDARAISLNEWRGRRPIYFAAKTPAWIGSNANVNTAHPGRLAILLEDIPRLGVGRAVVSGLAQTRVKIVDQDHNFATVDTDTNEADGYTTRLLTSTANPRESIEIVWKDDYQQHATDPTIQWCTVRLSKSSGFVGFNETYGPYGGLTAYDQFSESDPCYADLDDAGLVPVLAGWSPSTLPAYYGSVPTMKCEAAGVWRISGLATISAKGSTNESITIYKYNATTGTEVIRVCYAAHPAAAPGLGDYSYGSLIGTFPFSVTLNFERDEMVYIEFKSIEQAETPPESDALGTFWPYMLACECTFEMLHNAWPRSE